MTYTSKTKNHKSLSKIVTSGLFRMSIYGLAFVGAAVILFNFLTA